MFILLEMYKSRYTYLLPATFRLIEKYQKGISKLIQVSAISLFFYIIFNPFFVQHL